MSNTLRFMFVGDLVGTPGLMLFEKWIPQLKTKHEIDAIIVNGENAAKNGCGITPKIVNFLKNAGADVITTGNHVWDHKNIYPVLQDRDDIIRPANYSSQCPGKGYTLLDVKGHAIAVINIHGRVFIKDPLDCPFRAIESLLTLLKHKTKMIFVDFHAEATSEKKAMGLFLDGKVSGVYGTHTHVQTADEYIMSNHTGYITDIGHCGALNSVIGMQFDQAINRFMIHPRFGKFIVEKDGPMVLSGVLIDVDTNTGNTISIERIRIIDNDIAITADNLGPNDKK